MAGQAPFIINTGLTYRTDNKKFEEDKEYKDYKTKVDIITIENDVVKELKSLGIGIDQLTLDRAGNYWRQQGKDFLVNKVIEIKLDSPKQANAITNTLKSRGIQSMNIKEMKHSKLDYHKNLTKANAIKAAKEKAMMLTDALGEKIGRVLNIVEVDQYVNIAPKMYASMRTSAVMEDNNGGVDYENFGKIHIKENVRVIFEIQ